MSSFRDANPHLAWREERGQIVKQMVALTDKPNGADMTAAEKSEFGRLEQRQKDLDRKISAHESNTQMRQTGPPPNGQPGGWTENDSDNTAQKKAFRSYLRRGLGGMSDNERGLLRPAETRDMSESGMGTGAASGGGVLVPVGFVQDLEDALKYYGPMLDGGLRAPTIMPTATGQSLPWPTDNDTSSVGERIGEGQQVTMSDVSFGQVTFGAWKYSSKMIRVSMELLQDSAFPLEDFIARKMAERIGRVLNTDLTIGTGSSQPQGIVTAATLAGTAFGASSNDGNSTEPNTIGTDDLVTLEHSVDPLYRRRGSYMFHDQTLAALKKVKDKYGRPIWQQSVAAGIPWAPGAQVPVDTINGYPYLVNNDMDQLQTNASSPTVTRKTVLFGDLTKYTVRRVKEVSILRLTERFADFGQVAFIAFARYDGQLVDAGTRPVKYLQNVY